MYKSINSNVFKSLHLCACCCTWSFDSKQIIPFISGHSSRGQIRSSNLVFEAKTVAYPPFPRNSICIYIYQITLDNVDSSKDHKLRIHLKRDLNKGHFLFSVRCYIFCNNWMFWLSITHCRTNEKDRRPKLFWYIQFPLYS